MADANDWRSSIGDAGKWERESVLFFFFLLLPHNCFVLIGGAVGSTVCSSNAFMQNSHWLSLGLRYVIIEMVKDHSFYTPRYIIYLV